jgi:uncharacterized membrane protein
LFKGVETLSTAALVLYPVIVYAGISRGGMRVLMPLLLAVFALRLFRARLRSGTGGLLPVAAAIALVGLTLVLTSWILGKTGLLLYYPVAVSLTLLALFAWTLRHPPSIAGRIARLTEPDLPPPAIAYARKVTQIWCAFFVFNATLALATCLHGDLSLWTLYNGAVSYVLIGALMAGEWLVRHRLRRRLHGNQTVIENQ